MSATYGGKHKKNSVKFKRSFRLRVAMGSLNPHYCTHIKVYKHTTHTHTVVPLSKSPVSIKRAMNLPLKLVLQSGTTGWVTTHTNTQTGEELSVYVCLVCMRVSMTTRCLSPLRVIERKCWPLEKHT